MRTGTTVAIIFALFLVVGGATCTKAAEALCSRTMPCYGVATDGNGNATTKVRSSHRGYHLDASTRQLVGVINGKLRKWVRPSGKCGLANETLTTYYNTGRRTANGERFYPNGLTAASLKHPFGTRLHVTNPHTGKSVIVRINDRGPFTIAELDLAHGAARAIGMQTSLYLCVTTTTAIASGD